MIWNKVTIEPLQDGSFLLAVLTPYGTNRYSFAALGDLLKAVADLRHRGDRPTPAPISSGGRKFDRRNHGKR